MLIISEDKGKAKFNKPLYGMTGKYTLAERIALPYFASLLSIDRAINELRIAEQVPASLEAKWSLKELFQREIDEKRVRQDIVKGYLLDPKKLKFFNAITIVLMPKAQTIRFWTLSRMIALSHLPPFLGRAMILRMHNGTT